MARAPASPADSFLQPLRKLAARDPDAEALVFWATPAWHDTPTEDMDAGEIAFYAEGLIPEGFHLEWRVVAEAGATLADHLRLYVWEDGAPPPDESRWQVLDRAAWAPVP